MKKSLALILCAILFLGHKGQAFDPAIIKQNSSYNQTYRACSSSPIDFKNDFYMNVYQHSLVHTVQIFSLSTNTIYASLSAKGITPYLDNFLNDPATSIALNDCLGEEGHFPFVRNLLIIDSVGKAVGVSIGSAVWLGIGKISSATLKFILKPIAKFSPILEKRIIILTSVTLAGLGIYYAKTKYDKEEEQAKDNAKKFMTGYNERLANITARAHFSKDTKADFQFDISIEKAERKEGRKLTKKEIEMFCQILPGAVHRCF